MIGAGLLATALFYPGSAVSAAFSPPAEYALLSLLVFSRLLMFPVVAFGIGGAPWGEGDGGARQPLGDARLLAPRQDCPRPPKARDVPAPSARPLGVPDRKRGPRSSLPRATNARSWLLRASFLLSSYRQEKGRRDAGGKLPNLEPAGGFARAPDVPPTFRGADGGAGRADREAAARLRRCILPFARSQGYKNSVPTLIPDQPTTPERPNGSDYRSLPESFRSVAVPPHGGSWVKRLLAFAGPGFLVSVGYMDPGNWGTDLAGGSKFGYALLWVILASNFMAQFLQILCARLGLATGKDLAMACRDYYKKPAAIALWLLCELAIVACDLAEVIGSAVALNLLFKIPLQWGVLITGFDVLLLLGFMRFGFRKIEAIIITLVATIAGCFLFEMFLAKPDWGGVARGTFLPTMPGKEAFFISLGILGATVMPHNLYLHSSIVQTRRTEHGPKSLKDAIRFNTIDTVVALSFAFFVNAAILILAAAAFRSSGVVVEELQQGHELLGTLLGGASATVFAVALLAAGQSSTITGTLAGQIVMEGFLKIRIAPWLRRLITRSLAIVPAFFIIGANGGRGTVDLLVLSQVVLSMQLPFAIFPLVMVTSDRRRMGEFTNARWATVVGYLLCVVIGGLNVYLLYETVNGWLVTAIIAAMALFGAWVHWVYKEKAPA